MAMDKFTAEYKPKDNRPDEPILIGRKYSQARVSIEDAKELIEQLEQAVSVAFLVSKGVMKYEKY